MEGYAVGQATRIGYKLMLDPPHKGCGSNMVTVIFMGLGE